MKINKSSYPWLILLAVVALLLPLMVSAETPVNPLLEQEDDDSTPVAEPPPLVTTEASADDEPVSTPEPAAPADDEPSTTSDTVPLFVPQPQGPDLSGAVVYVDLTLLSLGTTTDGSAILAQADSGHVRVFEKPELAQLAPPRIHDTEGNAYDLVYTGAAAARTTVYMVTYDLVTIEPVSTAEAPTGVEETPVVVPVEPESTAEAPVATEEAPIVVPEEPVVTQEVQIILPEEPVATEEAN